MPMSLVQAFLIGGVFLLAGLQRATAESWYPLAVGNTWEYSYRNTVAYSVMGGMTNVTEGKMTVRIEGKETLHGKEYFKVLTDYHGLFGLEPTSMWLREDAEGVYSASELRGEWKETRALRYPLAPGVRWDYDDGEPGMRVADQMEALPGHEREYPNVLRVRREFAREDKAKTFEHTVWYAPGKGEVRFQMKQESGPMLSLTETIMLSFRPGEKVP
jgi:hypothetical protein